LVLTIVLVDDHHLIRAGIRSLLQDLPDCKVVGEAATGMQALELIHSMKPDLVLMDVAMPDMNGLELLARRAKEFPDTRVIILSMYSTEAYVLQALRSGASGYLLKGSDASELALALAAAARGDVYVSKDVSRTLEDMFQRQNSWQIPGNPPTVDPYERLTSRQRQVLQLIAEGHSTKAIAEKMGLSAKTVKTYRVQLMEQLEIHDVASLVRYAIRVGIIKAE